MAEAPRDVTALPLRIRGVNVIRNVHVNSGQFARHLKRTGRAINMDRLTIFAVRVVNGEERTRGAIPHRMDADQIAGLVRGRSADLV